MSDAKREQPSKLAFTKMQGVGNDFVLVDGRAACGLDWSGLAREMCDRRFGVGADGLLLIDTTRRADIAMRMFNPDGTPDVCGNGLRCVARYAAERLALPSDLTIATLAGVRKATVRCDAADGVRVTVDMGEPRFEPPDIPMRVSAARVIDYPLDLGDTTLVITSLSTGSTHTVALVDDLPDDATFRRISPLVEHHPVFPDRTSLMWARVAGPDTLEVRIWERGVGETLGCGTGACAVGVAARLHGLTDGETRVASKGGQLAIHWREGEPVLQTGPAEYVFEGTYPLDG